MDAEAINRRGKKVLLTKTHGGAGKKATDGKEETGSRFSGGIPYVSPALSRSSAVRRPRQEIRCRRAALTPAPPPARLPGGLCS